MLFFQTWAATAGTSTPPNWRSGCSVHLPTYSTTFLSLKRQGLLAMRKPGKQERK